MAELPDPRSPFSSPSMDAPAASRPEALPATAEVLVVGAGIAGLTAACVLAEAGRSVLVLEARTVAGGVGGATTATLSAHAPGYGRLAARLGPAAAAGHAANLTAAAEWVAATARRLDVDCELVATDGYVYSTDPARCAALRAEAVAARAAGLPAEYADAPDLPLPVAGAVRFAGQARFHPRRWLRGLARRVEALGGRVVEGVRATRVRPGRPAVVGTTAGVVRAGQVVVATHELICAREPLAARLEPVRDLVIAGPAGVAPRGAYLDADTSRSVHVARVGGEPVLVVGGEGRGDPSDERVRYARLGAWAREHLGLTDVRYRWPATGVSTVDGLPCVGRYHAGSRNLWVATGFGRHGAAAATAAGLLLRDVMLDHPSELATLYDPARHPGTAELTRI
jgi:glycine/D-amino acid oxidase-like deaminating enzyme